MSTCNVCGGSFGYDCSCPGFATCAGCGESLSALEVADSDDAGVYCAPCMAKRTVPPATPDPSTTAASDLALDELEVALRVGEEKGHLLAGDRVFILHYHECGAVIGGTRLCMLPPVGAIVGSHAVLQLCQRHLDAADKLFSQVRTRVERERRQRHGH